SILKGEAVYSCRAAVAIAPDALAVTIRDASRAGSSAIMNQVANGRRREARPERRVMAKRLLAIGCAVLAPFMTVVLGQAGPGGAQAGQPATASTAPQSPQSQPSTSPQRALLDRYCVGCHNQRAKGSGQEAARKLTLDDLDPARVSEHPDKWELVVRKLRAGMMPPANSRRPDKSTYDGFITYLENELDRTAVTYAP